MALEPSAGSRAISTAPSTRASPTAAASRPRADHARLGAPVRVLAIAYDGERNPSTRLRILQYIPVLEASGIRVRTYFVRGGEAAGGDAPLPTILEESDVIFVQRVLTKRVLRLLGEAAKPVVFDVDDAIHYIRPSQYARAVSPRSPKDWLTNGFRALVRGNRYYSSRKRLLDEMLDLASIVIVGNSWLWEEFSLEGQQAVILPTSVWLDGVPTKAHTAHRPVTIGWIGVRSNLIYLERLGPVFGEIRSRYGNDVELLIVSSAGVESALSTRFVPWSLEGEGEAVLSFDIGIMPLEDDRFSRGKSAFKAVFCMSRGVPVVASPVGANTTLIRHGVDGYLANTHDEWMRCLSSLVDSDERRSQFGQRARSAIEARFSAADVAVHLAEIFTRLADPTRNMVLPVERGQQRLPTGFE